MGMKEQLTLDPAKPIDKQKPKQKDGFFRSILQKMYPSQPTSMPSSQSLETFKFATLDFHTTDGKKMLYTILRRYGLIFKSVKLKAAYAIPSIDFKYHSEKEKKVMDIFLKNLHPTSGLLQLETFLRDWYKDTTAWGTGFIDPIWNKGKTMYEGLKKIHPIEIDLKRDTGGFGDGGKVLLDKAGNPKAWIQKLDDNKFKEAPFCRYAYLTFNTYGDEWLGISDLEPIYQTTWRLMNIEEGVATAIFRHGFPLYDVQVSGGSEGRPPTSEQLDQAAQEVKGLNYKSEFIHGPNYKVSLIESFSITKSKDYMEPFIDQIAALSDIPKFILLGSGEDIKAIAPELMRTIKPALKPSRDKLKLVFEEQVLKPLMEANHIDTTPELILGNIPFTDIEIEKELEKEKGEGEEKEKNPSKGKIPEKPKEKKEEKKDEETLEKDNHKKKRNRTYQELQGIMLTNPHGEMLVSGEKKQIVQLKSDGKEMKKLIEKEIYVLEDEMVMAKIKLREPREIGLNDLIHLEYAHQINNEERKEFFGDGMEFLVYEFDMLEVLEENISFERDKKEKSKILINKVIPR